MGERRGGVEVRISKDGRIYEMRCEDVSEAGSGRWFCLLATVSHVGGSR